MFSNMHISTELFTIVEEFSVEHSSTLILAYEDQLSECLQKA